MARTKPQRNRIQTKHGSKHKIMQPHYTHLGSIWADLVIQCLDYLKIHQIYLAPGSRSTPLVQALAKYSSFNITTFFDERSLAYSAVGYAKASGKPPCIITTSGTAVANTLPAIIEAFQSYTPLILLTADRPPELINVGANQAIDQISLLTDYVRSQKNITPATLDIPPCAVLTETLSALKATKMPIAGPVHINMMFREPLTETHDKTDFTNYLKGCPSLNDCSKLINVQEKKPINLSQIQNEIFSLDKGLIIAGYIPCQKDQKSIINLAEKLNWPLLPDITSGLRQTQHPLIANWGLNQIEDIPDPDIILLINGYLTSRKINDWLQTKKSPIIQLKSYDSLLNPWQSKQLYTIPQPLDWSVESLTKNKKTKQTNPYTSIICKNHNTRHSTNNEEQNFIQQLSHILPPDSNLVLSNSLPIRYFDQFSVPIKTPPHIIVNRGASGIDGILSTAIGVAESTQKKTILVIGDTAALYDMNAFKRLADLQTPLICIIINNNGGRIFESLSISKSPLLEPYFVMPTQQDFSFVKTAFKIPYKKTTTPIDKLPSKTTVIEWIKPNQKTIQEITN